MVRMCASYQLIVKVLLKIECRSIKPALPRSRNDSRAMWMLGVNPTQNPDTHLILSYSDGPGLFLEHIPKQ